MGNSVNELIKQIGGRERLQSVLANPTKTMFNYGESLIMARALLAVLDAQEKPAMEVVGVIGAGVRAVCYEGAARPHCGSLLYTTPPLSSEPVSNGYTLPDGWKLVPVEPTQGMTDAGMECASCSAMYRRMLAAAPAPGGE